MLKVLFICSKKTDSIISPFVKSQSESLEREGLQVSFFLIEKKGLKGYLQASVKLRKHLRKNTYNIVHAHYSFCGFVASLAGAKNIVVSLLGSDVIKSANSRFLIRFFVRFFSWKKLIVKSEQMKNILNIESVKVIPNGVDFNRFYAIDQKDAREILGLNKEMSIVLFNGQRNNPIKNYSLAEQAISNLNKNIQLLELKAIPHEKLYLYFNACDLLLSTSKWEGSPNIIKEAMACNTPIVATNVGDISLLFGEDSGNFSCDFNVSEISEKVNYLLKSKYESEQNQGRIRLEKLQLESSQVANKIIEVYNS
jgi:glycosyltransferase involved in cell wall biosynthesis